MIVIQKVKKLFTNVIERRRPLVSIENNEIIIDEYYMEAVSDLERKKKERAERLKVILKRHTYFKYFKVRQRYCISFKEFNRRVDEDIWEALLADDM